MQQNFGGTDLQIDYEMVEAMIASFRRTIEQLNVSAGAVQHAVQILDGGGMVGRDGTRAGGVLNDKLIRGITTSQDRIQEMIDELEAVIRLLRDGDSTARSRFLD